MKKKKNLTALIMLLAIVASVALAFTACDPDPADNIIPKGVDEKGIKYIRCNGIPKAIWQENYFILRNGEQRDAFLDLARSDDDVYEHIETPYKILAPILNMYGDEYFNEFNLVIVPNRAPNIGIRYKVEKIVLQDTEQLYIRINRIKPTGDTGDMVTYWLILIPVKKEYFDGGEIIVEYRDTYRKR